MINSTLLNKLTDLSLLLDIHMYPDYESAKYTADSITLDILAILCDYYPELKDILQQIIKKYNAINNGSIEQ